MSSDVDWSSYEPYQPTSYGPVAELTRAKAKKSFADVTAHWDERIEQLRRLTRDNGAAIDDTDAGVQALSDWFRTHVELDRERPERLRSLWYAVAFDIGLFLSRIILTRQPHLRWELFTGGRRNLN